MLGAEDIMMNKKGYGPCPEELKDYLRKWIRQRTYVDIHVKLQRQQGVRRRSTCCFEDPLKKKKSRIRFCPGGRLPRGSNNVCWELEEENDKVNELTKTGNSKCFRQKEQQKSMVGWRKALQRDWKEGVWVCVAVGWGSGGWWGMLMVWNAVGESVVGPDYTGWCRPG